MNAQNKDTPDASSHNASREFRIEEYLSLFSRGKWIIIFSTLLCAGAAVLYTKTTRPLFESSSLILIDMKSNQTPFQFTDLMGPTTKITNELEGLKSYSTSEAVARTLLNRLYLDEARTTILPILLPSPPNERQDTIATFMQVRERAARGVEFMPIKESDIIKITAKSSNPEEAALLANTYARVYADRNLSESRLRSRAIKEFLETQLQAKHGALDTVERALQGYMRSSGIVSLDGETNKVVQQMSQLEASRDAIEVEIKTRTKTLESYKQELATQEPNVAKAMGESNDAYIRLLQEQLARLEVQRDVAIAETPEAANQSVYSERLKEINTQIASLKKNLAGRTQTFLKSLVPGGGEAGSTGREGTGGFLGQVKQRIIEQQIELDGLAARRTALVAVINDYERQFNRIPQKSIELAKLQRSRLSTEKLYLLVEEKYNEAAITETSEFGYVRIMDPAVVPINPVSPRPALNLAIGLLLGFSLGVGIVFLRANLDVSIRTPEDLRRFGLSTLSTINHMTSHQLDGRIEDAVPANHRHVDPHLVSLLNPNSPQAESYRHLHTNIQYTTLDKSLKSIMVTSATPGEGKSTITCNLAIVYAESERRVLLVDADLRRPMIHSYFGLSAEPGLTDVLFRKAGFESVVRRGVVDNLDVLCCGPSPPNPAGILGSKKMQDLIQQVMKMYEVVLFDSPPLFAVTDAAVLSSRMDGTILVVSAGQSRFASVQRAAEYLEGVHGNILGVALNNFDARKAFRGTYADEGIGYGGYSHRYYRT